MTARQQETECGFCGDGTCRVTSLVDLIRGRPGHTEPCPYCHGTGMMQEGDR